MSLRPRNSLFRLRGFIPLGMVVGIALVYFSFFFDSRLENFN